MSKDPKQASMQQPQVRDSDQQAYCSQTSQQQGYFTTMPQPQPQLQAHYGPAMYGQAHYQPTPLPYTNPAQQYPPAAPHQYYGGRDLNISRPEVGQEAAEREMYTRVSQQLIKDFGILPQQLLQGNQRTTELKPITQASVKLPEVQHMEVCAPATIKNLEAAQE